MGKASSSKKVARAAKAAGRPGSGRSLGWPLLLGSVVVVGVLLIVLSRGQTEAAVAPKLGDHWHAAYGIYDCDHFVPNLQDISTQDTTGLHTHADGLMHMHPFGTEYTGHGANIGHWGEMTGLKVSDSSIEAAGIKRKNGDECDGKKGTLKLKAWDGPDDDKGHIVDKDYADYAPQEFTMWTLAFVPEGADIPKPPDESIEAMKAPSDVVGTTTVPSGAPSSTPSTETTDTTAPGSTESTAPSSTETTAPPATTTPTSAP